ncbi:hypothetical protein SPRG_14584 [Saprolegnia parasitica CBS 223.65]|uniref:Uncharacterized protein n=1 Tax=Saprolegnia parasitica (strain CBS 223.65) TaxID=695850 RepID=A0A067BNB5_SAPPC|nr:hypothetical protein SPRG_14584 [Saprolegnia parasitica CBS 223.65]KDO20004.1 hypothetical protein SPRG_14584 [Saprolegnia parasitica CBS 223.65]|eukprot:XP_012209307.1 hypothetical protein SPRG_14584 [Saprolegnia parasitica CBS 223.65]
MAAMPPDASLPRAVDCATRYAHMELVEWLLARTKGTSATVDYAAMIGHVGLLTILLTGLVLSHLHTHTSLSPSLRAIDSERPLAYCPLP